MRGEVWRAVPSVKSLAASSEGRIMTLPYIVTTATGKIRQYGGQPYFGVWNKADARFIIRHRGKTYKIARLVCEAFNGVAPHENAVVMHMDENAANNRPNNLKWGTQKENLNAPGFIAYCKSRVGKESPVVKGAMSKK